MSVLRGISYYIVYQLQYLISIRIHINQMNSSLYSFLLYCIKKTLEPEKCLVVFSLACLPNMDLLIIIFKLDSPIAGSLLIFKHILTFWHYRITSLWKIAHTILSQDILNWQGIRNLLMKLKEMIVLIAFVMLCL
jgi:hypothetical protein